MPGMGERSFVYAKACGMLGKSFIGSGIAKLNSVSRLSDLDRLIFSAGAKDLPERELLPDLERRIISRSVDQIVLVVSSFSHVPEFLVRLVQSYEIADLKTVLNALAAKDTKLPPIADLGVFGNIKFDAFPKLDLMLKNTEYSWILDRRGDIADSSKLVLLQIEIDNRYYTNLWKALLKLPKKDCTLIRKVIEEEITIRNIIWALRFKTYFNMDEEKITELLIDIPLGKGNRNLANDAVKSLSFSPESFGDWANWKWSSLVNPEKPGERWALDPRYVQNLSAKYLFILAKKFFHRRPFAIDTVACFVKLKQYEEDLLTSVAEGLSFGMTAQDVLTMLEVNR